MKDTLNIFRKRYRPTAEQRELVQPIWDEMMDAVEAAGEPEGEMYDGCHIGNAPNRFLPIMKPYLERIQQALESA